MSYILDALEKSRRERGVVRPLRMANIEDAQWTAPPGQKSASWFWMLGFCLVFIALAASVGALVYSANQTAPPITVLEGVLEGVLETVPEQQPQPLPQERPAAQSAYSAFDPSRLEGVLFLETNHAASRVFYKGRAFVEGEELEQGLKVLQISADEVRLSSANETRSYRI